MRYDKKTFCTREKTRVVKVGDVKIGGGNPVVVQSMTKTFTADVKSTVKQIEELQEVGCEIVRVAVPDFDSVSAIKEIKKRIKIPLVADIHFDYRLAIESIRNGADKIRINPGNIGGEEKVKLVIEEAKKTRIPIRIGLNSGSLKVKHSEIVQKMRDTLRDYILLFNKYEFEDIVISAKASDVMTTINIYQEIAKRYNYPLHIGVTESGPILSGSVKSSVGLGILLYEGLGDTIRVSLTGSPVEEVRVGYEILKSLKLRKTGVEIISCPTCGRCRVDLPEVVASFEKEVVNKIKTNRCIKIAIMGCEVNGPGEAKEADIGVAFGRGMGLLFVKGKPIKKVLPKEVVKEILNMMKK